MYLRTSTEFWFSVSVSVFCPGFSRSVFRFDKFISPTRLTVSDSRIKIYFTLTNPEQTVIIILTLFCVFGFYFCLHFRVRSFICTFEYPRKHVFPQHFYMTCNCGIFLHNLIHSRLTTLPVFRSECVNIIIMFALFSPLNFVLPLIYLVCV